MNHAQQPPRLIVPDLARGLALLGIATANAAQAWIINDYDTPGGLGWTLGGVRPGNLPDQALAVFAAMFVHVRGLPMFSTLLGFGIGLIAASLYRKHYPPAAARRVLVRRYAFLALFGLAHLFLLFYGDIMVMYGTIGVIVALLFTQSTRALRIVAYCTLGASALLSALAAAGSFFTDDGMGLHGTPTTDLLTPAEYVRENVAQAVSMLASVPFGAFSLIGLVLIGYVWAREGYLVDVDRHRRILVTWVCVAAAVVVLLGLPLGLSAIGVIDPAWEGPLYILNTGLGSFTGPGILAGLTLVADPVQKRMYRRYEEVGDPSAPAWAHPFVALGKRSMTGYLAQSFLFIAFTMPFTLGLGLHASITGKTGVAVLVWLVTLALASVLERYGIQGPFESLHRRLSYGPTKRLEPYSPGPGAPVAGTGGVRGETSPETR
ncbi:DUF418 domain-containing protein [Corynebacterium sp. UBA2622]|uniref:DUF418 domain-containing protein n=1 Tax=Corynebacterium sp. UBA2622 TaxID=1946393 RepID=UPI0025BEC602|nr:DUF418 domain-containing protein [Corynebacterium sp. UBA2622]